jgi:hypothetical protein
MASMTISAYIHTSETKKRIIRSQATRVPSGNVSDQQCSDPQNEQIHIK